MALRIRTKAFIYWVLLSLNLVAEITPYHPEIENPLNSKWAWKALKVEHDADITVVLSAQNGDLYMGVRDGIILYSNNEFKFYGENEGFSGNGTGDILESNEGQIFAINGSHLFSFDGLNWSEIDLNGATIAPNQHAYLASDDSIFIPHERFLTIISEDGTKVRYSLTSEIYSIVEDRDGRFWVALGDYGEVYRVNRKSDFGHFEKWEKMLVSEVESDRAILFYDKTGHIWFIDYIFPRSPISYSLDTQSWTEHSLDEIGGSNGNTSIIQSKDGAIWILSRGKMHRYLNEQWEVFSNPEYPVPANFPLITESKFGELIIAESGQNIHKVDYGSKKWKTFLNLHFQAEDRVGNKWFLSRSGEIVSCDSNGESWVKHIPNDGEIDHPMLLAVTRKNEVWCVGSHDGKAAVNILKNGTWEKVVFEGFAYGISHLSFYEDENGEIFLGSGQQHSSNSNNSGGVIHFKPIGDDYEINYLTPPQVPFRIVGIVRYPENGDLWFGGHSLVRFDGIHSDTVMNDIGLDGNWIDNIHATNDRLLITNWGKGIFQLKDHKWTVFKSDDGLHTERVSQLLCEDDLIVAATSDGIYRLDGERWFPYLSDKISIPRESGYLKTDSSGGIWINLSYIEWFYRGLVEQETRTPKSTGFKTIWYQPDKQYPQTFIDTEDGSKFFDVDAEIAWRGRDDWSVMSPEGMSYSYRIDDGEWSAFSENKKVFYSKSNSGRHTVQVRSRDIDFNIDQTPSEVSFDIIVPFYKQKWFVPVVVFVLITIVLLVFIIVRLKIRFILEIDEMKLRYFTNISHELRTPLTLILGPIENAINRSNNEKNKQDLSLAYKHALRLRDLVDQLLEFRKFENGKIVINLEETVFPEFLAANLYSFESLIIEKKQKLIFHNSIENLHCRIDQDKFQKIIYNLISNSIKYTQENGQIEVFLSLENDSGKTWLNTKVSNDGPSINQKDLKRIFEPYYQGNVDRSNLQNSSGIGLALTKQLVENHEGKISVVSPIKGNIGCRFEVSIPVEVVGEERLLETTVSREIGLGFDLETLSLKDDAPKFGYKNNSGFEESPLLLYVEDDTEIRHFIRSQLSNDFRLIEAVNGNQALSLAKIHVPDIILTDVMMPGLNGFELCKLIKSDPVTNHIPVIILTALQSNDYEIVGTKMKADDYLTKPISPTLLKLKLGNVLEARARLRERIRLDYIPQNEIVSDDTEVKEFLNLSKSIINKHIDDSLFGVDEFAEKMSMSRSAIYRKFKAITDDSPASFIRMMRLRKASSLLRKTNRSIVEISLEVGFSEASVFSRSFKDHFGISPKEYRILEKQKNRNLEAN